MINYYIINIIILFSIGSSSLLAQDYIKLLTELGSDLPLVVITTDKEIQDEPKITGHMGIINKGPGARNYLSQSFNEYDGFIGVELRGQSSLRKWDKTSFAVETRDSLGDNNNVSIFGMPKENDWVLNAAYYDKTLVRMPLIYEMSRKMGNWATHTKFCEVVVNDEYMGIYIFMEKIKIDKNRVDIAKLDPGDINLPEVTGGYIYEFTSARWGEPDHYEIKSPVSGNLVREQEEYITEFYENFNILMSSDEYDDPETGYMSIIDINSFVDEIIMQEVTKSVDAYRYSSYFHKEREGKLYAGPIWDFDQSFGNSVNNGGSEISGWIYPNATNTFWPKLINEELIQDNIRSRWKELRDDFFNTDSILSRVDFYVSVIDKARLRNFERWPNLGVKTWREPDDLVGNISYEDEVLYMKNWITDRLDWMDKAFGNFETVSDISAYEKIEGEIFGSTGSWNNLGNTIEKVFDGDLTTFFDSPVEKKDVAWVGNDLGIENQSVLKVIGFAPRINWEERMIGGYFEASNNMAFLGAEKILEIFTAPEPNKMTYFEVNPARLYRYVRYKAPQNSYGNIAELEFYTDKLSNIENSKNNRLTHSFDLKNNFPNPFNPSTTIPFEIPERGNVKIEIYNSLGEKIKTLVNRIYEKGIHHLKFNGKKYKSGVYFYRIEYSINNSLFLQNKKMVLLK